MDHWFSECQPCVCVCACSFVPYVTWHVWRLFTVARSHLSGRHTHTHTPDPDLMRKCLRFRVVVISRNWTLCEPMAVSRRSRRFWARVNLEGGCHVARERSIRLMSRCGDVFAFWCQFPIAHTNDAVAHYMFGQYYRWFTGVKVGIWVLIWIEISSGLGMEFHQTVASLLEYLTGQTLCDAWLNLAGIYKKPHTIYLWISNICSKRWKNVKTFQFT